MEASPINNENIFLLRKTNVWYTIMDGSWSNPDIWISNAIDKKNILLPQQGDTVYINHNVDYSNNLSGVYLFNNVVNNLFVNGSLTANGTSLYQNNLTVNGNLYCSGIINFSGAVSDITLTLNGFVNQIANFNAGTLSTVSYNSQFDQAVWGGITYNNVIINNQSTKFLLGDLIVTGTLNINSGSALQIGESNYAVNNTVLGGTLKKNSSTGIVNFTALTSTGGAGVISFTGSPTINMSGSFNADVRAGFNFGSGTLNINTNSTWTIGGAGNVAQPIGAMAVIIAAGVTLTLAPSTGTNGGGWINNGSVTGASSTSILNINGTYAYGNTNIAMPTGVFNYNNSGTSLIQVQSGVTMTLPITNFYALNIIGIVTLGGNTTVSNNLALSGSLQLASYNFTCSGIITLSGSLLKSGGGIVNLNTLTNQNSTGSISFTGSPTINLSGNVTGDSRSGINLGSGTVNITSNLNFGIWNAGNTTITIGTNIVIASGVIFTNTGLSTTVGGLTLTGTITGAGDTAIFINASVLNHQNATAPMTTGNFYCNQTVNTVVYGLSGNQNITSPSDPSSPGYYNLTLNGSGAKTLLENVSVKSAFTLTSPATLNSNGYALTNP